MYFATTEKYTVFAVDSGGSSLELFVQTMYLGKEKKSITDTANTDANATVLTQTSKTPDGTALNNNIRTENTKSQYKYFKTRISGSKRRKISAA